MIPVECIDIKIIIWAPDDISLIYLCWITYVTQRQLMRLFAVKLILSYEQKCEVKSKFLKN